MPLPIILGVGAAISGIIGVGSGINGAVKMKEANDTIQAAQWKHEQNVEKFEKHQSLTNKAMDELGELELNILHSFEKFANTIEKIQNRPKFKEYSKEEVTLPQYDGEKLKNVSVGAGILLGGLGGAAVGTAGGFAAAGATTSAVMALGTASTGTAIASLSGAAATNATLAALGGGAIGSSGIIAGGMSLGTQILGAATLGVGLLVGGVIFNVTGSKLSDQADEAYMQMREAEKKINKICEYLSELEKTATKYIKSLNSVCERYQESFKNVDYVVNILGKTDYNKYSESTKLAMKNSVLLVGLLYRMCKVNLVVKTGNEDEINAVNTKAVNNEIQNTELVVADLAS